MFIYLHSFTFYKTISFQIREFGVTEVRDILPDGRNIKVTEEEKEKYVKLVCQMKMTGAIRKQIDAFLRFIIYFVIKLFFYQQNTFYHYIY